MKKSHLTAALIAGLALVVTTGVLPAAAAVTVTKSFVARSCGSTLWVALDATTLWSASYVRNNGSPIVYAGSGTWAYHRNLALHSVTTATVSSSGGPMNGVQSFASGCALS